MIDDAGDVRLDLDRLDPLAAIQLDPDHDAFGGLRAFLEAGRAPWSGEVAGGRSGDAGPCADAAWRRRRAFDVAIRAVREHLRTVRQWVAGTLPECPQVVVIDEPGFSGVLEPGFPSRPTPRSTSHQARSPPSSRWR